MSSDLNPLDLVAREIIAYKFSSSHAARGFIREAMRDVETVAVVTADNTLLVAYNEKYSRRDASAAAIQYATSHTFMNLRSMGFVHIKGYKILSHDILLKTQLTDFHAEMQLIQYCVDNHLAIEGGIMGVSKPCCGKCARILKVAHVEFSLYSKSPIGSWQPPRSFGVLTTKTPSL